MVEVRLCKKEEIEEVVKLSSEFEEEGCCNGVKSDNYEYFLARKVVVAIDEGKIIGYAHGGEEVEEKDRTYAKAGDKYFELDEIYVKKEYRSQGVGKMLYWYLEAMASMKGCKTVRLNAVSKDYKKLLNLYIDELGMEFISAYLVKQI